MKKNRQTAWGRQDDTSYERDRKRKWWQAKEHPRNWFDRAPIFFTVLMSLYFLSILIPGLAMLFPPFACLLGASEIWCPVEVP